MKKGLTELVFFLDRSGSMVGPESGSIASLEKPAVSMIYPMGKSIQTRYEPKLKSISRHTANRKTAAVTMPAPIRGIIRFICPHL